VAEYLLASASELPRTGYLVCESVSVGISDGVQSFVELMEDKSAVFNLSNIRPQTYDTASPMATAGQ
jgi:hypothetical protein